MNYYKSNLFWNFTIVLILLVGIYLVFRKYALYHIMYAGQMEQTKWIQSYWLFEIGILPIQLWFKTFNFILFQRIWMYLFYKIFNRLQTFKKTRDIDDIVPTYISIDVSMFMMVLHFVQFDMNLLNSITFRPPLVPGQR